MTLIGLDCMKDRNMIGVKLPHGGCHIGASFKTLAVKLDDVGVVEIELMGTYRSARLLARKVWETLFHLASLKDSDALDSFLVDLSTFEEFIQKRTRTEEGKCCFYWYYDGRWWTNIVYDPPFGECICWKIEVDSERILLSKQEGEKDAS